MNKSIQASSFFLVCVVSHFFELGPDLSSAAELHDHVDVPCVFESSVEPAGEDRVLGLHIVPVCVM